MSEDSLEEMLVRLVDEFEADPRVVARLDLSLVRLSGQDANGGAGKWGFARPTELTVLCPNFTVKVLRHVSRLFPNLMAITLPTRGRARALCVGDSVKLTGLKNAVHLNDKTGTCLHYTDKTERWDVQFEDGTPGVSVKPGNLLILGETESSISSRAVLEWLRDLEGSDLEFVELGPFLFPTAFDHSFSEDDLHLSQYLESRGITSDVGVCAGTLAKPHAAQWKIFRCEVRLSPAARESASSFAAAFSASASKDSHILCLRAALAQPVPSWARAAVQHVRQPGHDDGRQSACRLHEDCGQLLQVPRGFPAYPFPRRRKCDPHPSCRVGRV